MVHRQSKEKMGPKPDHSRTRSHVKPRLDHAFVGAGKRVIHALRTLKVRERLCGAEFEERPDPALVPLYAELIKDPVSIRDLEQGIKSGAISTPETLTLRFLRMVRNAKSFNRQGSTIYKDADRMFSAFQHAMRKEMNFSVQEDDDDMDEEEAWGRDLRERPQLAAYERGAFMEAQSALLRSRSSYSAKQRTVAEKEYQAFVHAKLEIKECRFSSAIGKELNRQDMCRELAELRVSEKDSTHRKKHDESSCMLCDSSSHEAADAHYAAMQAKLGAVVVTPKFREIKPPQPNKPSTPRPLAAAAPSDIEPAQQAVRRKSTRKRTDEHFSLDIPAAVVVVEQHDKRTRLTGPRQHHHSKSLRSRSPDSVSAVVTLGRRRGSHH